jgi:predicted O-linked N-acetylglucosamine transferase (SPINDLY family)
MATRPADQLKICRSHAAAISAGVEQFTPAQEVYAGGRKLRIGYLSADFCRHATALLMAELLERHDKTRFEIIAYSHGPDDFSALGARHSTSSSM